MQGAGHKNPHILGFTIALCDGGRAVAKELFTTHAEDESTAIQDFIRGFSASSYQREGEDFLNSWVRGQELSELACAAILLGLPSGTLIWDIAEKRGNDCALTYWQRTTALPHRNPAEVERAARALLGVGRVLDALCVLGTNATLEWLSGEGDVAMVCDVLRQAIEHINADHERAQQVSYCTATLLKNVSACGKLNDEAMTQLEWMYFGLLRYQAQHELVIYRRMAAEPSVLVDLLALLYVSDQADKAALPEPTDAEKRVASNAWHVLYSWHPFEKISPDAMVSAEILLRYADDLSRIAAERGYLGIALDQFGKALASAPVGTDGTWPHESVRAVLERFGTSAELQEGFVIGRINLRGSTSRAIGDGGNQERQLADQYRKWQRSLALSAPRTSGMLGQLADNFDQAAIYMDVSDRRRH